MQPGLIFVNDSSGTDAVSADDVKATFDGAEIEPFDPETVAERVSASVAAGVSYVGVAGGDGSIGCVAHELRGTDVALLAIPAGTRNHFARELGMDDLSRAAAAVGPDGVRDRVDVGEVNGRVFLNNASVGLYPDLVAGRERRPHLPKMVGNVASAWEQLRRGRKIAVSLDGTHAKVWMLFVGNGCYGEEISDVLDRESLTDNVLDVRVVRADGRAARLRVVVALALGRLRRSPMIDLTRPVELTVDSSASPMKVALDGEVVELPTPLHFRSVPRALVVLKPPAE